LVAPDADQLSVGLVATPIAPDAGVGLPGVPGREPVPAVVNDHVEEFAVRLANVVDTTFQKYVVPAASGVGGVHAYVQGGLVTSWAATLATRTMLLDEVPR